MKYCGTLISVSNMEKAREFYEGVMEQKILMESMGIHVSYESGLSLQFDYEGLVGEKLEMHAKPNNFQLYFEVDDIDCWEAKIKSINDIEFLHNTKEYPWGQRVIRFYDYDKYIIELSESMNAVVKRFVSGGMSIPEVAERMGVPEAYVETLLS